MLEKTTSTARSNSSAERTALVADCLRDGDDSFRTRRSVRLRVYGESMLPSLWPGDVVEIENCSLEEMVPGEIVLAERGGQLFLHRLMHASVRDGFLLRGDSMPGSDPEFPREALLGRLVAERSFAGRPAGGPAVAFSRAAGILFCYSTMARRVALKLHQRRAAAREMSLGTL
jgi:hypothetical protein